MNSSKISIKGTKMELKEIAKDSLVSEVSSCRILIEPSDYMPHNLMKYVMEGPNKSEVIRQAVANYWICGDLLGRPGFTRGVHDEVIVTDNSLTLVDAI